MNIKTLRERYALSTYNSILKNIEKETGNKSTYSNDLERIAKEKIGISFKGVFASDRIPHLNSIYRYAILNLDSSMDAGSHWIAIAHDYEKNITYCYDSFGRKNVKIIPKLKLSGNGRIIDTDRDAEQDIREENCGARSLAWLVFYELYGSKASLLI